MNFQGQKQSFLKRAYHLRPLLSVFYPNTVKQHIFLALILAYFISFILDYYFNRILVLALLLPYTYFLLKYFIDKPVKAVLQLTRQGGFDLEKNETPILGQDEFSRIARSIKDMAFRMQSSINRSRDQNTQIDEIFAAIDEGVIIVDDNSRIIKMNHTLRRWLGWYTNINEKNITDVLRNVEISECIQQMIEDITHNKNIPPQILESIYIEGVESKYVRAKIIALNTEDNKIVFIVFLFDLTDIHHAESLRREFFANVSHELKTPIAAIRGYSELIQDLPDLNQHELVKTFLAIVLRNADHLTKLIDEMLLVTSLESRSAVLSIQPYDFHINLQRIIETILPKAQQIQVKITTDIDPSLDKMLVDAQQFDSMLLNLIDNAVKYNKHDGLIKISARQNNLHHLIYIEDSGIGIPKDDQSRIFERFYRIDKSHTRLGGGSGLGLSIVKHIIQAHGGSISLSSEVDVGSVFTILIPKVTNRKKIF